MVSKEDALRKLEKGELKLHELENFIFESLGKKDDKWGEACAMASEFRLTFIEKIKSKKFGGIRSHFVDTAVKPGVMGIENQIGAAATPLGIAGPIKISGDYAKGEFYLTVATNEAALIAGLSRGCKTINESGGALTIVTRNWMTRAPVLDLGSSEKARELANAVNHDKQFYGKIKAAAESESKVSKLEFIETFQVGKKIWLRFAFETGDSMGMNSVTKYSANAIKEIKKKFPHAKLIALSGNMCSDKKSNHVNIVLGRGKAVEAETVIKKEVLEKIYNTDARTIEKINFTKNYQGSALSGTLGGFNANAANTVAAMFLATGQDSAQVVESSSCFVTAEEQNGDLYFSVSIPNLEVATVGGGTNYATAKDCLEILGCAGAGKNPGDNSKKLAEIIASAVLAQELNLLGALANDYELAESHIRMARGKN
ncbi:MAG: hydroxymethylglutaryl-CoA reductase [Candidatus Aenigmarchaeota archaeon]|nr:hydroxymethylglutaryl-CoA reductase [Candidatus Aenigmarchaeota archaeon]